MNKEKIKEKVIENMVKSVGASFLNRHQKVIEYSILKTLEVINDEA